MMSLPEYPIQTKQNAQCRKKTRSTTTSLLALLALMLAAAAVPGFAETAAADGRGPQSGRTGQPVVPANNEYSISGTVQDQFGRPLSGITVNLTGAVTDSTTTAADGTYSFSNLLFGQLVVVSVAATSGYSGFSPVSHVYSISGDVTDADFEGTASSYTIGGTVEESAGVPIAATVTMSGDRSGTMTTSADGSYQFVSAVYTGDSITLTPGNSSHSFSPAETTIIVTPEPSAVNFTGTVNTYTISGMVTDSSGPVQGVILTFSHDSSTANTAADGTYTKTVEHGTTTTITPSHSGYQSWSPASRTLTGITSNQTGQDFAGTLKTYSINGRVTTNSGAGIANATVWFDITAVSGVAAANVISAKTNALGAFSLQVEKGTTGLLTVDKGRFQFSPGRYTITNVNGDITGNDFSAPAGDLSVLIEPAEAVQDGARWKAAGWNSWKNSGRTERYLPAGEYTLQFRPVEGWMEPDPVEVTVQDGQTTRYTVAYQLEGSTGSVRTILEPADARDAGARWVLSDRKDTHESGVEITDLEAGSYSVNFREIDGWIAPEPQSFDLKAGENRVITGTYQRQDAQLPAIRHFTATTLTPLNGETVPFSWEVENADSVIFDEIEEVPAKASRTITISTFGAETRIVRLRAVNENGDSRASVTISPVDTLQIDWFTSSNPPGDPMVKGGKVSLMWQIRGATEASIHQGSSGGPGIAVDPQSGIFEFTADRTEEYTLVAKSGDREVRATSTTAVSPQPWIGYFKAVPDTVIAGNPVTFMWEVQGADVQLSIEPEIGLVTGSPQKFTPSGSGEYELRAENELGGRIAYAGVTVLDPFSAPDIIGEIISVESPRDVDGYRAGQPVYITAQVRSEEDRPVVLTPFDIRLMHLQPAYPVDSARFSVLNPGQTKQAEFVWYPPRAGEHTLRFEADHTHNIVELDEENNNDEIIIDVQQAEGVDLLPASIEVSQDPSDAKNRSVAISFRIHNAGTSDSGAFQYNVILQPREGASGPSVVLSKRSFNAIKAGKARSVWLAAELPAGLRNRFEVRVEVDPLGASEDIYQGNNNLEREFRYIELPAGE